MLRRTEVEDAQRRAAAMLECAGLAITPAERTRIEVADFGLGELERTGLQLLTYVNTDRYCAKELVLFPAQTCHEHRHPPVGADPGKMETFRCRWGAVRLYVEGAASETHTAQPPAGSEEYFTVFRELILVPGEEYTVPPNTLHWFQAGPDGVGSLNSVTLSESG